MATDQFYIIIGIIVLAILTLAVVYFTRKKETKKQPSQLAMLGITFVVLGIILGGDNRLFMYSFFGVGIILSVIDIIQQQKAK